MRLARGVLVIAMLVGVVWIGQGVGLIRGSFMTGHIEWSIIGGLVSGAAAIALWWTAR
ncbi:MAG TPA: hypothetical protein VEU77_09235 [Candidatus Acidoferrales bacterium]|nr:hypothetical protein [Candidatus Acidoferrales bacterium]